MSKILKDYNAVGALGRQPAWDLNASKASVVILVARASYVHRMTLRGRSCA